MSTEAAAPTSLVPALAAKCAEWFPEMGGRFIAVSEIEPFDNSTNVPTLPIGFVALVTEKASGTGSITIVDDVMVHFAFKPVKYQNVDKVDTPFFAFYDYEPVRDKLVAMTQQWRSPRNMGLAYKGLAVEATEFAVYMTFRFEVTGKWCMPEEFSAQPIQVDILANMVAPPSTVPCIKPEPEPADPCAPKSS